MLSALLGHWATCSTISWEVAFSSLTHGLWPGRNTRGRPRAQLPQCTHSFGRQRIVTSPLEYLRLSIGTAQLSHRDKCPSPPPPLPWKGEGAQALWPEMC